MFGSPLYFTAAYWVDGLLIDTGCAHTAEELCLALRDQRIDLIVNTHSHEDHIGANADLAGRCNCPIVAHARAAPNLAQADVRALRLYQRVIWGRPKPSNAKPVSDWIETDHYRFQVVYTPGHSDDHICLFEPEERWLFCGDAYVGGRDRALRADYDIWQIISSLRLLAQLEPWWLFPGGGTVKENAESELRSKIGYLEEMGGKVLDLAARGWPTRRIARKLFGRELPIAIITFGHFSAVNLVRSFLSRPSGCRTVPEL